jgi:hypothetical protein
MPSDDGRQPNHDLAFYLELAADHFAILRSFIHPFVCLATGQ